MRTLFLTTIALIQANLLSGAQTMYVSLCNVIGVPESVLATAKVETRLAFEAAGVDISWEACDPGAKPNLERGDRLFIVRLLGDPPVRSGSNVWLETMGRAFTQERGSGFLADVYVHSVDTSAAARQVDRESLLGLVISHELGHLILGPGHVPAGIMCGTWKSRETEAMRKRWLRFHRAQAVLIQQELEKRAQAPQSR